MVVFLVMEAFRGFRIFVFFAFLSSLSAQKTTGDVVDLNEDNWSTMLTGEWMVEFMAPWCPACSSLKNTWQALSGRTKYLGVNVATVDVTTSPGLSGRFLVTALPTIYHVINGELRQYTGPRDLESLLSFITDGKWNSVTPAPWYRDPTKPHMALLSHFFRLSQLLRSVHNTLLEEYGVPTYGSYLIFAIATIFLGGMLGLMVVCTIDFLFPPKRSERRPPQPTTRKEEELINDDLVDEEEEGGGGDDDEEDDSDAEKNSQSDTPEESDSEDVSDKKKDSGQGDRPASDKEQKASPQASPNVRKRKPRKAD